MQLPRRALLALLSAGAWSPRGSAQPAAIGAPVSPRPLLFPADHGAHLGHDIEWWYATGWLQRTDAT